MNRFTTRFGFCACVLASLLAACSDTKTSSTPDDNFDRAAMFSSVADHVLVPSYQAFLDAAEVLDQACDTYAQSRSAADKTLAQTAWRAAMQTWQVAEMLQVGPAGNETMVKGGENLRDEIYSWPTSNPCRVDQETVSEGFLSDGFIEQELVNAYGLDALEYLLFAPSDSNQCASQVDINTSGAWDALAEQEVIERRARYAGVVAKNIHEQAQVLLERWQEGGSFRKQFLMPGSDGSVYSNEQCVLDELFASMFYLDLSTKDAKLALPLGLTPDCSSGCEQRVESPWAQHSVPNIRANLNGFYLLFRGGSDPAHVGFDDYLTERGGEDARLMMEQAITSALGASEAIELTLAETLDQEPDKVTALYEAIRMMTDELKSQFVTVLNLSVPQEGAADND